MSRDTFMMTAVWLVLTQGMAAAAEDPSLDELLEIVRPDRRTEEVRGPAVLDAINQRLTEPPEKSLFYQVINMMSDASNRLEIQKDAGVETQRIQSAALDKLDRIISEAERSENNEGSQAGGDGNADLRPQGVRNRPQQSSASGEPQARENLGQVAPGSVNRVTAKKPLEQLRREWGHLPQRIRNELIQSLDERFSPLYRKLTEAYFRRLAEDGK